MLQIADNIREVSGVDAGYPFTKGHTEHQSIGIGWTDGWSLQSKGNGSGCSLVNDIHLAGEWQWIGHVMRKTGIIRHIQAERAIACTGAGSDCPRSGRKTAGGCNAGNGRCSSESIIG